MESAAGEFDGGEIEGVRGAVDDQPNQSGQNDGEAAPDHRSRRATTSTIRALALPSQSSGTRPPAKPLDKIRSTAARAASGSGPTKRLVPCSTVIGRSVFSR